MPRHVSPFPESGPIILRSAVPPHLAGRSLAEYLTARFTYHDAALWGRLIDEGHILCNGLRCAGDRRVHAGDEISYIFDGSEEPDADLNYSIVYEDQWLLGIDKTGNLLCHRAGKALRSNLMYQIRCCGNRRFPEAGLVNRLDRETSGIVLAAKDTAALTVFSRLFRNGMIEKEYTAIVHGSPRSPVSLIDEPIAVNPSAPFRSMHHVDRENGKRAVTEIVECAPLGADFSRMRLRPRTGRTHQLRVHLSFIGCPVVGDKIYGPTRNIAHLISRQALHCGSVRFDHPFTRDATSITAPMPSDMTDLVRRITSGCNQAPRPPGQ